MLNVLFTAALATSFIYYLGLVHPNAKIESVRDLGPVLEVVVKCPSGTAIMSYSKIERIFCTPQWACYGDMNKAAAKSCN